MDDDDPDAPTRVAIEKVLNKAKGWYRYTPNCWLIYTARDAEWWFKQIHAIPGMEDYTSFLLCEVLLSPEKRAGWLKESAWEWINKKRTS